MKNNITPALIQAHSSVHRAMSDIRLAAKIIRKQHDQRQEPNNHDTHIRIEGLMREMLFDVQRLIGCEAMRHITNSARHE